jgi:N-acetylmuramoyl-L-alanine amidase
MQNNFSLKIATAFFSLCLSSSVFAAKIVIDPGHGGVDDGAVRGKLREADIALKISNELASQLRAKNHEVVLTRHSDKAVSLKARTDIAEKEKADLFISIHANASEDVRAKGVEFYFQNQLPADEEAMYLASKENQAIAHDFQSETGDSDVAQILADLQRNYKLQSSFEFSKMLAESWSIDGTKRSRMIRQAPFYVISQTTMPSVLVEVGFVSHKAEGPMLSTQIHQREIASQIAKAVDEFSGRSLASPIE